MSPEVIQKLIAILQNSGSEDADEIIAALRNLQSENEKIRKHYEELTPLKRLGDPDDIGGIAVF